MLNTGKIAMIKEVEERRNFENNEIEMANSINEEQ